MALQKDEHRPFVLQSYYCDPSLLERLVRFYEYYNPEKINLAEAILFGYRDDPELLFMKLRERYGPEPHTVAHISQPPSATSTARAPGVRPSHQSSSSRLDTHHSTQSGKGGQDHAQDSDNAYADTHFDRSNGATDTSSLRSMMLRDVAAPFGGDKVAQESHERGTYSTTHQTRSTQNADLGLVDSAHRSTASRQMNAKDSFRAAPTHSANAPTAALPPSTFAPYGSFESLRRSRAPAPTGPVGGAVAGGVEPSGANDSSRAYPSRVLSFAQSPERDVNRNHVYATGLERLSQSPLRTPPLPKQPSSPDSREYLALGRSGLDKGGNSSQPLTGYGPQMTYTLNPAEVIAKRKSQNPQRFQSYEKVSDDRGYDNSGDVRNGDSHASKAHDEPPLKHTDDFSDDDDGACDELEDAEVELDTLSCVGPPFVQRDRVDMLGGRGHAPGSESRAKKTTTSVAAADIPQRGGSRQLTVRHSGASNDGRRGHYEADEASETSSTGAVAAAHTRSMQSTNEKYCVICRTTAFRGESVEGPVWSSVYQRAFQLLRHPVLRCYPFFHYRLFLLLSSAVKARRNHGGSGDTVKFFVQSTKKTKKASPNNISSLLDGVILRGTREDLHGGKPDSNRSTSASSTDSSTSSSSAKENGSGPFPFFERALESRVMWEASSKAPNLFNDAFQSVAATELHTLSVWCRTIGLGKWFKDSVTFADAVSVVGIAFNSQWGSIRQLLLRDVAERTARSTAGVAGRGREHAEPKPRAGTEPSDMLLLLEVIEDVMSCARVQTTRSLMQCHAQWMRTHYNGEIAEEMGGVNEFIDQWADTKRGADGFGYMHPSLLPATLHSAAAEEEGTADMYSTSTRSSSRHYDTDRMRGNRDRNAGVLQVDRQMQLPHSSIRLPAPLPSLPLPLALLFESMELVSFPFFGHARHHRLIFVEVEAMLYWMSVAVLVETEAVERQTVILAAEHRAREKLAGAMRRLKGTLALEAEEKRCRQEIEGKANNKFLKKVREFRGYVRTLRLAMHRGVEEEHGDEGGATVSSRRRAGPSSAASGNRGPPARYAPSSTQQPSSLSSRRRLPSAESSTATSSESEEDTKTQSAGGPESPEEHSPFRATIDVLEESEDSLTSSQLLSQYYALRQLQKKPSSHEYTDRVSDLQRPSHGRENAVKAAATSSAPYDPTSTAAVARYAHGGNGRTDPIQFPRRNLEASDWFTTGSRTVAPPAQQLQHYPRRQPAQYVGGDPSQYSVPHEGSSTPSMASVGSRSNATVRHSVDSESMAERHSMGSRNRVRVPPGHGVMIVPRSHSREPTKKRW